MILTVVTSYASAAEIKSYLKAVTCHYGIDKRISFRASVNQAIWNEDQSTWTVSVSNHGDFECEILVNACGILNAVQYPSLKGLESFRGPLLHTAAWTEDVDLSGKKVAVIGAGASAIQMLPVIAHKLQRCDIYIRTPSWITPPFGTTRPGNFPYTEEDKQKFRDDPDYSLSARKSMETEFNKMYGAFTKNSDEQSTLRSSLERNMKILIRDPDLHDKLIPKFDVGCRRINPGVAYLETLQNSNVHPIFEPIQAVTANGITVGGQFREVDVIIVATGFDTSFKPRFPIIGTGKRNLRDLWSESPVGYCGIGVSGSLTTWLSLAPILLSQTGVFSEHLKRLPTSS